mmetsp:Transcript_12160/g.26780  ORF Transcript_12160/g.26780 Transcript_12160/m.26780 type:complete len:223 (-) Transcript_12160:553-1221(-)
MIHRDIPEPLRCPNKWHLSGWLRPLPSSRTTSTARGSSASSQVPRAGDLLACLSERCFQFLVGGPLHSLRILEPLDKFHFLFFHLGDQGVCTSSQQLLLSGSRLIIFPELLELGETVLLQAAFGVLLPGFEVGRPLGVRLFLSLFALLLLQQELLRLFLGVSGIRMLLFHKALPRLVAQRSRLIPHHGILGLSLFDGLPFRFVEVLLGSELVFVLFSQLHDL